MIRAIPFKNSSLYRDNVFPHTLLSMVPSYLSSYRHSSCDLYFLTPMSVTSLICIFGAYVANPIYTSDVVCQMSLERICDVYRLHTVYRFSRRYSGIKMDNMYLFLILFLSFEELLKVLILILRRCTQTVNASASAASLVRVSKLMFSLSRS